MSGHGIPRLARWIVALTGSLVPRRRREVWRRQWEADLQHLDAGGAGAWRTIRFSMGSLPHALYLRREEGTMTTTIRGFLEDLKRSVRALIRRPGFSLLTVLTLAVGIGTATAVYSLAEAILFRPLPLPEADELTEIVSTHPARGWNRLGVSYPDFRDLTARDDLFQSASFYQTAERDVAGDGGGAGAGAPRRLTLATVHRGFFETLRPRVALGRLLVEADQEAGAPATVVLSDRLWRSRYGSDPDMVGRTIRLDGVPHTVVGVLEAGQGVPVWAEAWVPLQFGATPPEWADRRSNHTWQVVARLEPGVDVDDADEQIRAMARSIYQGPVEERDRGMEATVLPLRAMQVTASEERLFAVMGLAVLLVLVIACMNTSGLLMTHLSGRARELSLRSALGASRGRLVAQLLSESFVLALAGGALGTVGAVVGMQQLLRFGPPEQVGFLDIRVNGIVLAGAVGLSLLATVLAGLLPALGAAGDSVAEGLKEGTSGSGAGAGSKRLRSGLVVAELALSVMLLTGAGLMVRSFQQQLAADPGFRSEGLLSFSVRLPEARYGDDALVRQFYDRAVGRLETLPGVRQASAASALPLGGPGVELTRAFAFEGEPEPPEGVTHGAYWIEVGPGYFEALGVSPLRGRGFNPADREGSAPVIVVNRTFAERLAAAPGGPGGPGGRRGGSRGGAERPSPGTDVPEGILGRRIRSVHDESLLREVVGIVPDLQRGGLTGEGSPAAYVPTDQSPRRAMSFLLRTAGDPGAAIPGVRAAMSELDPDVALDQLQPLEAARRAELGGIRLVMALFGTFGIMALILAVSGVYGQVAYSVSRRTREIGVRMAVGATAGGVLARVLGEGARLTVLGLTVGVVLALGFAKLLSFALFGLPWLDPRAMGSVIALLALAAFLATLIPARRATRVDPVEALRTE